MEISNEKIQQYKAHLKKPYWELHEATYLLMGFSVFSGSYNLFPEQIEAYKTKYIGIFLSGASENPNEYIHFDPKYNKQ